jgi:hypothetical protein
MGLPVALPSGCDASLNALSGLPEYTNPTTGDHGLNRGGDMIVKALQGAAAGHASENAQLRCRLPRG